MNIESPPIEKLFEVYADLKIKEKEIQEQIKITAELLLPQMIEKNTDKLVKDGIGTLSLESRKTWKYSPRVIELEGKVDDLKSQEKADGTATYAESRNLKFTAYKAE